MGLKRSHGLRISPSRAKLSKKDIREKTKAIKIEKEIADLNRKVRLGEAKNKLRDQRTDKAKDELEYDFFDGVGRGI